MQSIFAFYFVSKLYRLKDVVWQTFSTLKLRKRCSDVKALRARYTQQYSENMQIIQYFKNIFKCNMVKNIFEV